MRTREKPETWGDGVCGDGKGGGGGRGRGCSLHAHVRGHPDVASSRECDSVREEGNQRDIVSQTLLKGGQSNTRATQSQTFKASLSCYYISYVCLP